MPDRDAGSPTRDSPGVAAMSVVDADTGLDLSEHMAGLAVSDDASSNVPITAVSAAPAAPPALDTVAAGAAADASGYYDHIEIEDMEYDEEYELYHYPCPCGDRFEITLEMLRDREDVASCPSCSLLIKVIYDAADLFSDDEDGDDAIPLETTITVC
ncbi:Diphthamide biosynthesis protein 3 [Coemansia biformis]|uniref:Diphthamide biosynthesis protein 3 n=1 Tax=Coemansia biformis TaxID=1286918 RepID=A0A9W8CW82_9FUNG|nr:Diphthamide biosynthesis protein 3 [Coemansia biformis]